MGPQWLVMFVVTVVTAFLIYSRIEKTFPAVLPSYATKTWARTSAPLLVVQLFSAYFPEIAVILVGFFLPSEEIAIYNAGARIALLIAFGLHAIDAYMAPQASQLYAKRDITELQLVVNRATALRFWAALSVVLLLAVWGTDILGLFGEEFVVGYPVLMILAFGQLIRAGVGPVTRLLTIGDYQMQCMYIFSVSLIVAVILFSLLVPQFGIVGAGVASFLTMMLWSIWFRILVAQNMNVHPSIFISFRALRS